MTFTEPVIKFTLAHLGIGCVLKYACCGHHITAIVSFEASFPSGLRPGLLFLYLQINLKHRWRVHPYKLLFDTSVYVIVLSFPDKWPLLQVYSQNRSEHIAVVLSDAVCELCCEGWRPYTVCSSHVFLCVSEALVIAEPWHASCGGFWTSLICWHCSDPLPVPCFLVLEEYLSLCSSLLFFFPEVEEGDRRTHRITYGIMKLCIEREKETGMTVKWVMAAWHEEEVGRRWPRGSGKGREREIYVCAQCATPLYVPFTGATDRPPISQLLGCSKGSNTQQLLFFLLARPTAI